MSKTTLTEDQKRVLRLLMDVAPDKVRYIQGADTWLITSWWPTVPTDTEAGHLALLKNGNIIDDECFIIEEGETEIPVTYSELLDRMPRITFPLHDVGITSSVSGVEMVRTFPQVEFPELTPLKQWGETWESRFDLEVGQTQLQFQVGRGPLVTIYTSGQFITPERVGVREIVVDYTTKVSNHLISRWDEIVDTIEPGIPVVNTVTTTGPENRSYYKVTESEYQTEIRAVPFLINLDEKILVRVPENAPNLSEFRERCGTTRYEVVPSSSTSVVTEREAVLYREYRYERLDKYDPDEHIGIGFD